MSLLEKALQERNYELAALPIVYGMLRVIHDRKETQRCPQGQPERSHGFPVKSQISQGVNHGFYSRVLDEAQKIQLDEAREVLVKAAADEQVMDASGSAIV